MGSLHWTRRSMTEAWGPGLGVTRGEDRGFKLLGAPVGSQEYEREVLESKFVCVVQLDRLNTLQDPHHMEYTLLQSCFSFSKMAYSMRTVDVLQHEEVLINFDKAVPRGLERMLGAPLSQAQWTQASLPVALGEMVLRPELARAVGRDERATVLHLWQRLGVVLLRDNVSLLSSHPPAKAPAQVSGLLWELTPTPRTGHIKWIFVTFVNFCRVH